jgi:hypothetical protein
MKLVTVPIVGKLTSGGKRSYSYNEEPDEYGMYGTSDGGYRYGFGPGGKGEYYDFSQLPSFCTNVPLTFQQQQTTMIMEPSRSLLEASNRAKKLIQEGKPSEASKLLKDAIKANAVDPR